MVQAKPVLVNLTVVWKILQEIHLEQIMQLLVLNRLNFNEKHPFLH